MKILKNKNKTKILIAIFGLLVLNLLVLDVALFGASLGNKARTFLSERSRKLERENIFEEINPSKGYALPVVYGDLGLQLLSSGVIDLDKFIAIYKDRGGLPKEELNILTKGSNERIKITRENSDFLLNFFWAVGLLNNSKILTGGQMKTYGDPGNFASTGGWTLGRDNAMNYYSKTNLFNLSSSQEDLVWKVSSNIYRPCCDNPTSFPDCNHGMALLGVLELMASKGSSEQQMFDAAKYFNAFWFPQNYYDLTRYFKDKEGKDFSQIDARIVLGKDYSSATGYSKIKQWLIDKGKVEPEQKGASCGV